MNRLVIVGALVLLILIPTLVCFGIFYGLTPLVRTERATPEDILEAQGAAHSFLDDVRNGNLDGAYGRTSGGFKGRQSKEEFQGWTEKYPQLLELSEESMAQKGSAKPTAITYDVVLAAKGKNRFKLNLTLVKEGDDWKVDAVSAQ